MSFFNCTMQYTIYSYFDNLNAYNYFLPYWKNLAGQKYDEIEIEILNYLTSQSDKIQNFGNDLFSCYIGNKTNYNQSFSYKK